MRKPLFFLICSAFLFISHGLRAQTISNFESFAVVDTFVNGINNPLGYVFQDGNMAFENYYDTAWGGYWSAGFAISGIKDSVTPGSANLYGATTASGEGGSNVYAMGTNFAKCHLTGNATGKLVDGVHITNSTYAAISMRDGDNFAKKFGGADGNDPDWFKIDIIGFLGGSVTDTVEFYLADYRFSDNSQDYIVRSWEWVDLQPLGNVDTIMFYLSSSDNGQFGMNTPAFFAIDNFKTMDSGLDLISTTTQTLSIYPNPANNIIRVDADFIGHTVEIFTMTGTLVKEITLDNSRVDISSLIPGNYLIRLIDGLSIYSQVLVKE